ncbi:hypothetical protein JCM8547_004142 [Rhodosporidiobolus lusitaniae]
MQDHLFELFQAPNLRALALFRVYNAALISQFDLLNLSALTLGLPFSSLLSTTDSILVTVTPNALLKAPSFSDPLSRMPYLALSVQTLVEQSPSHYPHVLLTSLRILLNFAPFHPCLRLVWLPVSLSHLLEDAIEAAAILKTLLTAYSSRKIEVRWYKEVKEGKWPVSLPHEVLDWAKELKGEAKKTYYVTPTPLLEEGDWLD